MKRILVFCVAVFLAAPVYGKNYLLNGGQESTINYQMIQKVKPSPGTRKLVLSFVVPKSFRSLTYHQKIEDLDFNFSPSPTSRKERTDSRGNQVIEVTWKSPSTPITATIHLRAINRLTLESLKTNAPFPLKDVPDQVQEYLEATEQVGVDNKEILS